MPSTPVTITEVHAHPAAEAWERSGSGRMVPAAVTALKPQRKPSHKSGVYRLHEAEPGIDVIAKRCRAAIAARERVVYERILPALPTERLRYYGFVDEPDSGYAWLFMEDAGDQPCGEGDEAEFTEWLARLHASASLQRFPDVAEQGPPQYLDHLRAGRRQILANLGAPHLLLEELQVLHSVLRLLDAVEDRWAELDSLCRAFQPTLVHGDLASKNIRVRRSEMGVRFFALDWETAGWGVPAADLAAMSHDEGASGRSDRSALVDAYVSTVRPFWGCTRPSIELLAHVGLMFRMAAAIDWASRSLPYAPGRKPVHCLRSYGRRMSAALSRLGWSR